MNELIQQLVSQLGVNPDQAKGGAGLLFKMVQGKLGGDFSKITQALPAVTDLIKAAPAEGGASKLLGGLASSIGGGKAGGLANLASLAGGFSQLKLDPATASVPLITSMADILGVLIYFSIANAVLRFVHLPAP